MHLIFINIRNNLLFHLSIYLNISSFRLLILYYYIYVHGMYAKFVIDQLIIAAFLRREISKSRLFVLKTF